MVVDSESHREREQMTEGANGERESNRGRTTERRKRKRRN